MNIDSLIDKVTEDGVDSNDLDLSVYTIEYYQEEYQDWYQIDDMIIDNTENLLEEVIKELKRQVNTNQPLKVRIFDRDYVILYKEDNQVMCGDLGGGYGSEDYLFDGNSLQPTEFDF